MSNNSAFATPEIEARYHAFWNQGGRWWSLTPAELHFVETMMSAPALHHFSGLLDTKRSRLNLGALMTHQFATAAERVMAGALVTFGASENLARAGIGDVMLSQLPIADHDNVQVFFVALLARIQEESALPCGNRMR